MKTNAEIKLGVDGTIEEMTLDFDELVNEAPTRPAPTQSQVFDRLRVIVDHFAQVDYDQLLVMVTEFARCNTESRILLLEIARRMP